MKKHHTHIFLIYTVLLFFLLWNLVSFSQTQSTKIIASLHAENHTLEISQKIVFYNYSKDTLQNIVLHNWMNSYSHKKAPLSKRLIEDYDKALYFAKKKDRGYSKITSIHSTKDTIPFIVEKPTTDILRVVLKKPLIPKDSITLLAKYTIKIPNNKFTKYGTHKDGYDLRYWYLSPAVYQNNWQEMSNFNMDDMYSYPTNFEVEFQLPKEFLLESNLHILSKKEGETNTYLLKGKKRLETTITLSKNKEEFNSYDIDNLRIVTNFKNKKIENSLAKTIANRQINFLKSYLGKYPHAKILADKIIYDKNPVYGLNQLPSFFNPFDALFKYDIQLFKLLSNLYINTVVLTNKRNNYWVNDGIQTYLMLKYIEKYYPEKKAIGKISKIWGIRSYKIAQLDFNDKYPFVYQFAMRKNLDQALNTPADSLSTFNRKIVNKYKAGLGLVYLNDYLGANIIDQSMQDYYAKNLQIQPTNTFKKIIQSKTTKNLSWFFRDYIQTNKKIDYTIKKVKTLKDSLLIEIQNKSNFTAPISIYGIKDKKIKYKKWFTNITDFTTIKIPKGDFNRISLNYEAKYPEINLNNNWKNLNSSLFNRPLQLRFMKDIDNPYYNQLFYNFDYAYNYYDGVILGTLLTNKTVFKKKWQFAIHPTYGLKNNKISGSLGLKYTLYPKNYKNIQKLVSGINFKSYDYAKGLSYQRFTPYIAINFKRKSLRNANGRYVSARYLIVNKEVNENSNLLDPNKYAILNIQYGKYKNSIIKNTALNFDFQLAKKISKLSFKAQYRKTRKNNTQIDLRVFAGTFLFNNTTTDFYDYSLNRPSDYFFDYKYFGRSESTGFLSQQIIIAEGGFKSIFDKNTANQWMLTSNGSIGIWRWIEVYGDVGVYKNNGFDMQFKYDSGIRLNFVQNFFEVYFPIQSSNGFEIKQDKYPEKIRFVVTLSLNKIYSFVRRGFY